MWVKARHGYVPPGAVAGGTDIDGNIIYVARAYCRGELLPANLIPSKYSAIVCTIHQTFNEHEYEVLCNERVTWKTHNSHSPIPREAIPVGHRDGGRETLYMGRVLHDGALIPGKVHSASFGNALHIPYYDNEVPFQSFEILTSVPSS